MTEPLFSFLDTPKGRVLQTTLPDLGKTFSLDYTQGTLGFRLTPKRVMHEPLAKLVDKDAFVFDAMGGLAKDAIIFALLGCKVWTCEPHPLVAGLVKDGLQRARKDPVLSALLFDPNRFRFFEVDALSKLNEFLDNSELERPDIVYLDPMFPEKQKTSIAKKEMQWLQQIHAHSSTMFPEYKVSEPEHVFECALKVAKKRVIIKRPLRAPRLVESPVPSYSKQFQSARFDVYC